MIRELAIGSYVERNGPGLVWSKASAISDKSKKTSGLISTRDPPNVKYK